MNTRFNPTTDGALHLGHVYIALVNEYEAHHSGGKFILRFDDNQEVWDMRLGRDYQIAAASQIKRELDDLGIQYDECWSQHGQINEINKAMFYYNDHGINIRTMSPVWVNNSAELIGSDMVMYPYFPALTVEKVACDQMDEINLLIRGVDLITESSLYAYICDCWRVPAPRQVYLPRLLGKNGESMSKSLGNYTIKEYFHRIWTPDDIKEKLAESCLIDPAGPWSIDNVKPQPIWKG